jgi:hypothetical protein
VETTGLRGDERRAGRETLGRIGNGRGWSMPPEISHGCVVV